MRINILAQCHKYFVLQVTINSILTFNVVFISVDSFNRILTHVHAVYRSVEIIEKPLRDEIADDDLNGQTTSPLQVLSNIFK